MTTYIFKSRRVALAWIASMFNVPPWLIDYEIGRTLCLCEPDGACGVCDQA